MAVTNEESKENQPRPQKVEKRNSVTIRFCGDSGDGMQLTGGQFTTTSALIGNDISTFPDFPAEIRAPAGTLAGVSGFQLHFSADDIHTPGDQLDALVTMNPAAFKTNIKDLKQNGILIANKDAFTDSNLKKVGYEAGEDILEPHRSKFTVIEVAITDLTMRALEESPLPAKAKERCKNFFALGLSYWIFNRPLDQTIDWLKQKFAKKPEVYEANIATLKAGYHYGSTIEALQVTYEIPKAEIKPGTYRNITGNTSLAIGLVAASQLSELDLFYGSYPITPASDILQELASYKHFGVKTFQAEDEIAAIGSAVGAAFAGQLSVTGTSGPGICLKSEFMNLAVIAELPLVVINVQRGGPSTGLPTKAEQSDLLQVLFGRNGESPMPVLASSRPSDCFDTAIEACRIATRYMTPVVILSDGSLANGSEPWLLPKVADLPKIKVKHHTKAETFKPYDRNEFMARPWAKPGTPGCEHTLGGLEKENITGKVNLSPEVHEMMVDLRARKIANIAGDIPKLETFGEKTGDLLILSWGSGYGPSRAACEELLADGHKVGHVNLRHINPLPLDLGDIVKNYKKVLMPEMNLGQLRMIIRSKYLVDVVGYNKVNGKPFFISDVVAKAREVLKKG